jgi:MSHA biogenesis protein MshJ
VLTFAAIAAMMVALTKSLLIDPLLVQQKKLSVQLVQQQEKLKETQAQTEILLQAEKDDASSPLRLHLEQIKQQIADGEAYMQSRRDHLVAPEKMGDLLEQVLNKNGQLQLMSLNTLPATPVLEKILKPGSAGAVLDKQIFKHGVQITVRGSYLDLLQYLSALEQLPTQMFWGMAEMRVEKHPDAILTLTVYTLSLDKVWLQI